uniref:C-type lectin domain containing 11A n=1 Tax=Laticauda laticaudata TaxID=8630 RepID=A0A8C5SKP2_LATLA
MEETVQNLWKLEITLRAVFSCQIPPKGKAHHFILHKADILLERVRLGRRTQTKCFLIFKHFETYNVAQKLCEARGGHLAMPADDTELTVLRRYLYDAFQPYNWPSWVGIHDRRSEGLWLFENGQRVSIFDWYQDHLVTQPNGGTRENCVSLSSDDGKWWDNDCERRMYYICEYRL